MPEPIASPIDPMTATLEDPSIRGQPRVAAGTAVGRYLILSELGRGGMGVVYAAYDPELDRRIALKLVREASDSASGEGSRRLLREAQAMARLSHPNVIVVHDVGVYEGKVFLAMEFIDGGTLGAHLRTHPRPWREVLDDFCRAGEGLLAAHEAGLVHRDFKPDNVLVGRNGRVCVTDFGIAQARTEATPVPGDTPRQSPAGSAVDLTRPGAFAGTPAFMAPEQFSRLPIDARTDQFAFCVATWTALFGTRPFQGDNVTEIAMAVTAGEMREPPPSDVPQRVRRALERGLQVSPDDRWPSMRLLLDELARDTRRARGRVFVAGGVVVALAAGTWTLTAREPKCVRGAARMAEVWDDTTRDAVGAALVSGSAVLGEDARRGVEARLDTYSADWVTMHDDACAATHIEGVQSEPLLDMRMACLDRALAETAAVIDVLATADAAVTERAVRAVGELPALSRCADVEALRRGIAAPTDPYTASEVARVRSDLVEMLALERTGRYAAAREAIDPLLTRARALDYPPLVAEVQLRAAMLDELAGDFAASETRAREAYFAALRHRHDEVAAAASTLLVFVVGYRLARPEAGNDWAEHAEAAVARWAPGGREEARLRKNVGNALHRQRRLDDAALACQQAHDLLVGAFGPDDDELPTIHACLGAVSLDQARFVESREHFTQGMSLLARQLGPAHPSIAQMQNGLGNVAYTEGDLVSSAAHYNAALSTWERVHGEHPAMTLVLNNLGNVADDSGDVALAQRQYARAVEVGLRTLGGDHPDVATPLVNLALLLERQGDDRGARDRYQQALAIREKRFGVGHASTHRILAGLVRCELRLGLLVDATARVAGLTAAAEATDAQGKKRDAGELLAHAGLVRLLAGETDAALAMLERAWAMVGPADTSSAAARIAFALARGLAGRDPTRAAELRALARERFVAGGRTTSRDLAELDATP